MRGERLVLACGVAVTSLLLVTGCLEPAFRESVMRSPAGVRLVCKAESVEGAPVSLSAPTSLVVLDARRGLEREEQAGVLPDIETVVPFAPGTDLVAILRSDLERRLTARGVRFVAGSPSAGAAARIDARLIRAHVEPTLGWLANRLDGGFSFELAISRVQDDRVLWYAIVQGRHTSVQRTWTGSDDYQAALSAAYCEALEEAAAWASTPRFQSALAGEPSFGDPAGDGAP